MTVYIWLGLLTVVVIVLANDVTKINRHFAKSVGLATKSQADLTASIDIINKRLKRGGL